MTKHNYSVIGIFLQYEHFLPFAHTPLTVSFRGGASLDINFTYNQCFYIKFLQIN